MVAITVLLIRVVIMASITLATMQVHTILATILPLTIQVIMVQDIIQATMEHIVVAI